MTKFTSSFDRKTKLLSAIFSGVVFVAVVPSLSAANNDPTAPAWLPFVLALTLLLVPGLFVYSLRHTEIRNGKLRLVRWLGAKEFDLTDIHSARLVAPGETAMSIRLFGNGGMFGYTGLFRNSRLGQYNILATRSDSLILLETDGKPFLFSADESGKLLKELMANGIPQADIEFDNT